MREPRIALVAVVAVLVVLTAACGSSKKTAVKGLKVERTTTTTEAPTTTSTTLSPEQAVLAGYLAFWDDYIAVGTAPDGAAPRLSAHAVGAELTQIRKYFTDYRAQGLVQHGTVDHAPRVVSVAGSSATVRDCYVSHLSDVDAKTGQVRSSDPQVKKLVEYPMQLDAGVWKVAFASLKGTGCIAA